MKNTLFTKNQTGRDGERGNVLILIFTAIILFAALGFTVSNIIRSGNPDMIGENQSLLYADEILDYARSLRQTIQNLRIDGCDPLGVSFQNNEVGGYIHGTAADNCKVFHEDGGGLTYVVPSDKWLDESESASALYGEWYFPANVCIPDVGTAAAGCDSTGDDESVIVILPYIKLQVCEALVKKLDIGDTPPVETSHGWSAANTKFTGTMADGVSLDQDGLMIGCFEGSGSNTPPSGTYHFFQVLVPR